MPSKVWDEIIDTRWSWWFHLTVYDICNYFSVLASKVIHVNELGPRRWRVSVCPGCRLSNTIESLVVCNRTFIYDRFHLVSFHGDHLNSFYVRLKTQINYLSSSALVQITAWVACSPLIHHLNECLLIRHQGIHLRKKKYTKYDMSYSLKCAWKRQSGVYFNLAVSFASNVGQTFSKQIIWQFWDLSFIGI